LVLHFKVLNWFAAVVLCDKGGDFEFFLRVGFGGPGGNI